MPVVTGIGTIDQRVDRIAKLGRDDTSLRRLFGVPLNVQLGTPQVETRYRSHEGPGRRGRIHLAHLVKDLPTELDERLQIGPGDFNIDRAAARDPALE